MFSVIKMLHRFNTGRALSIDSLKKVAFYVAYYVVIVGFSYLVMFCANMAALHRDLPYLTGMDSPLRLQPGMSIRPRPDSLTSLIKFKAGVRSTSGAHIHDLLSFVHGYERHTQMSRLTDCTSTHSYIDHAKYSCKFPIDIEQGHCNIRQQFGFDLSSPCIAVKLNRVIGWVPALAATNETRRHGFPSIKIKCEGVTQSDREQYDAVCYYDEESPLQKYHAQSRYHQSGCSYEHGQIRHYYFPYKKQNSYQIPFVWTKIMGLRRHVVVRMQCWAVADNIEVDFERGLGSVRFEILVD